jgi:uncharacterized protein YjbI with pentapeptide repeats
MLMKRISIASVFLLLTSVSVASDLGYRYENGKCVNAQGEEGLNPGKIGPCGDLRGVVISRLNLEGEDLSGARFDSADLQTTSLKSTILEGTNFSGANLSGVDLSNATIHGTDFTGAVLLNAQFAGASLEAADFSRADMSQSQFSYMDFSGVKMTGTKLIGAALDYAILNGVDLSQADLSLANLQSTDFTGANLTSAKIRDADLTGAILVTVSAASADFTHSSMRQVKLGKADVSKANFRRAQLDYADLTEANFTGADLRVATLLGAEIQGANFKDATYNKKTVLPFDSSEAEQYGLILAKTGDLLIIYEPYSDSDIEAIQAFLKDEGTEVRVATKHSGFMGEELSDYSVVLHLQGYSWRLEMPVQGQQALVDFVKEGGTYISTAWGGYSLKFEGKLQRMPDLILIPYEAGTNSGTTPISAEAGMENHPLLEGIELPMMINASRTDAKTPFQFAENPVTVVARDGEGDIMVAERDFGAGKVIGFAFSAGANDYGFKNRPALQLLLNAMNL